MKYLTHYLMFAALAASLCHCGASQNGKVGRLIPAAPGNAGQSPGPAGGGAAANSGASPSGGPNTSGPFADASPDVKEQPCSFDATKVCMTPPLSSQKLLAYAQNHQVAKVDDLLVGLPNSHRDNVSLMFTSASRQTGTAQRPRQIMYGRDARLLLAVGGGSGNAADDQIEFAEFSAATGIYTFGTLSFDSGVPKLSTDDSTCQTCHGTPARPIWGSYPNWPGAYGNDSGGIPDDQYANFQGFAGILGSDTRFRNLNIDLTALDQHAFELYDRQYSFPNTVLDFALGNTVGIGIYTRMQQAPNFAALRPAVLLASSFFNDGSSIDCSQTASGPAINQKIAALYATRLAADPAFAGRYPAADGGPDATTMLYRLLGIDPANDMNLVKVGGDQSQSFYGNAVFFAGAYSLDNLIAYLAFHDLRTSDADFGALFSASADADNYFYQRLTLTSEDRGNALQNEQEYPTWYTFSSVYAPAAAADVLGKVCQKVLDHLTSVSP